jgi:hypothetical protein
MSLTLLFKTKLEESTLQSLLALSQGSSFLLQSLVRKSIDGLSLYLHQLSEVSDLTISLFASAIHLAS